MNDKEKGTERVEDVWKPRCSVYLWFVEFVLWRANLEARVRSTKWGRIERRGNVQELSVEKL